MPPFELVQDPAYADEHNRLHACKDTQQGRHMWDFTSRIASLRQRQPVRNN